MWIQHVQNPKAITHLYKEVPALENVEITAFNAKQGCSLRFFLNLPEFADFRPVRWSEKYNTVAMEIDFWAVQNLEILGLTAIPVLSFSMSKSETGILVNAVGVGMRISFSCSTIYIQNVSGFINSERMLG